MCIFRVSCIAWLLVAMVSCSKAGIDSSSDPQSPPFGGNFPESRVKVIHASPKLPAINLGFDQDRINSDFFSYRTYMANYIAVTPGNNVFKVFSYGSATPMLSKTIDFKSGKYYSVFITDTASRLDAVSLLDDPGYSPGVDSVKLRFVNMSPDAGVLDLYVQDDEVPLVTGIDYKQGSPFFSVKNTGKTVYVVKKSGKEVAVSGAVEMDRGTYNTILVSGYLSQRDEKSQLVVGNVVH
ncbi:MAG: DUF4397 domain-containing protein [Niabella sp.]